METKPNETNPNDASFPLIAADYLIDSGLTKREYFAAMALQGFITKYGVDCQQKHINQCVFMAEFLIEELNKKR